MNNYVILLSSCVDWFVFVSAYAQQLEDMIAEKQEALEALREKTRAFRYLYDEGSVKF